MRLTLAIALSACTPTVTSMYAPNPDIDGPGTFGHVEGIVLDRVTGLPIAYANLEVDGQTVGWSDEAGRYEITVHLGRAAVTVIDAVSARWMEAAPFSVEPEPTTHTLLAADHHCTSVATSADEVFELVLATRFGTARRGRLPIVDYRKASAGNSVSIAGVDLTTYEAVQDESDRSHKSIEYVHVDAELVTACAAVVTVGRRSAIPRDDGISMDEGSRELYGKTAAGWQKVGELIGYAE